MPYEVVKRHRKAASGKSRTVYCVRKVGGTRLLGCHETPKKAYAQIAAIERSEKKKKD